MAPELIMGEPFDGRVDQYALAVTVYEILCGRRPFESDAKTKLLVLHTSKAPPRLTKWCPTLSEGLSQAVLMGLAKDPKERYRSCAALAAAVAAEAQNPVAIARRRPRPAQVPGLRKWRICVGGRIRQADRVGQACSLPCLQIANGS